jgi:16S rRNA processing protein RimM
MGADGGDAAFLTIARVMKVQGRHGEVLAELHTDFPERFEQRRTLYGWRGEAGGERRPLQLEDFWSHKGGMVFKFAGVDSIEAAESLLGLEIQIPAVERAELEEGAFYISELLGCLVVNTGADGSTADVGKVTDVNFGAGTAPLLLVHDEQGKEFMIPFVESFITKLELKAKRIEMQLPDGMLELDAPLSSGKSGSGNSGAGKKDRTRTAKG